MKILIMGLPGNGKTSLAAKLSEKLNIPWFNADRVRNNITTGLGFSREDRISQAKIMGLLASWSHVKGSHTISDFVCPTQETREAFEPDLVVWIDRIQVSVYEDTNQIFERPTEPDVHLTSGTIDEWCDIIIDKLESSNESNM